MATRSAEPPDGAKVVPLRKRAFPRPEKESLLNLTDYGDMKDNCSYAFIDLPSDKAEQMLAIIRKRGWDIGGGPPPGSFANVPPVNPGYVRVWGITWSQKRITPI